MKKLFKVSALILASALILIGCKQPTDESKPNKIELSDGNWTMKMVTDTSEGTVKGTFHFTVANGECTYTSGSYDTEVPLTGEELEYIDELASSPDIDINEALHNFITGTPENVIFSYDSNTKVLTTHQPMSSAALAQTTKSFDFSEPLPAGAEVTVNDDKTEYVLKYTEDGVTSTITLTKDAE